jgi:hypothetical protein
MDKQPEHIVSKAMKRPMERHEVSPISEKAQNLVFIGALKKLAYLGNGDKLGDSQGNIIAQRALIKAGIPL